MNIKHQALLSLGEDRGLLVYVIPKGDRPGFYVKNKVDLVICPKSVYESNKIMIDDTLNETGTILIY